MDVLTLGEQSTLLTLHDQIDILVDFPLLEPSNPPSTLASLPGGGVGLPRGKVPHTLYATPTIPLDFYDGHRHPAGGRSSTRNEDEPREGSLTSVRASLSQAGRTKSSRLGPKYILVSNAFSASALPYLTEKISRGRNTIRGNGNGLESLIAAQRIEDESDRDAKRRKTVPGSDSGLYTPGDENPASTLKSNDDNDGEEENEEEDDYSIKDDYIILATDPTKVFMSQYMNQISQNGRVNQRNGKIRNVVKMNTVLARRNLKDNANEVSDTENDCLPLYSEEEIQRCISRIQTVNYNEPIPLGDSGITVTAKSSGYCIGGANWEIKSDVGEMKTIIVSDSCFEHTVFNHSSELDKSLFDPLPTACIINHRVPSLEVENSRSKSYKEILSLNINAFKESLFEEISSCFQNRKGGNIIIPMDITCGLPFNLIELILERFYNNSSYNDKKLFTVHVISPQGESALSYSNICGEWMSSERKSAIARGETPLLNSLGSGGSKNNRSNSSSNRPLPDILYFHDTAYEFFQRFSCLPSRPTSEAIKSNSSARFGGHGSSSRFIPIISAGDKLHKKNMFTDLQNKGSAGSSSSTELGNESIQAALANSSNSNVSNITRIIFTSGTNLVEGPIVDILKRFGSSKMNSLIVLNPNKIRINPSNESNDHETIDESIFRAKRSRSFSEYFVRYLYDYKSYTKGIRVIELPLEIRSDSKMIYDVVKSKISSSGTTAISNKKVSIITQFDLNYDFLPTTNLNELLRYYLAVIKREVNKLDDIAKRDDLQEDTALREEIEAKVTENFFLSNTKKTNVGSNINVSQQIKDADSRTIKNAKLLDQRFTRLSNSDRSDMDNLSTVSLDGLPLLPNSFIWLRKKITYLLLTHQMVRLGKTFLKDLSFQLLHYDGNTNNNNTTNVDDDVSSTESIVSGRAFSLPGSVFSIDNLRALKAMAIRKHSELDMTKRANVTNQPNSEIKSEAHVDSNDPESKIKLDLTKNVSTLQDERLNNRTAFITKEFVKNDVELVIYRSLSGVNRYDFVDPIVDVNVNNSISELKGVRKFYDSKVKIKIDLPERIRSVLVVPLLRSKLRMSSIQGAMANSTLETIERYVTVGQLELNQAVADTERIAHGVSDSSIRDALQFVGQGTASTQSVKLNIHAVMANSKDNTNYPITSQKVKPNNKGQIMVRKLV